MNSDQKTPLDKSLDCVTEAFTAMRDEAAQHTEDDLDPDEVLWNEMYATLQKIKAFKPNDRSELDRRVAVTITKYQDVMSWYNTMILESFDTEEDW